VTAERTERAPHPQLSHCPSEATKAKKERRNAEIKADDEDWAITPAGLPLERMIVIDASGDEMDPQPSARAREHAPSVLNVEELAALLRVNRKTVYDALARGEIPGARRIGATYRILRDAVLEWLASGQDRVARSPDDGSAAGFLDGGCRV
jgi:excisionase family DNA binding protein